MLVLVIDTETSDLPKSKFVSDKNLHLWPFIVQFSYLIYDTNIKDITLIYDSLIKLKPYNLISEASSKIHHITNEISEKKGSCKKKVLSLLYDSLIHVNLVIGHNLKFDLNMIEVEILRCLKEENDSSSHFSEKMNSMLKHIHNLKIGETSFCTMQLTKEFCNLERENSKGKYIKFPTLLELHHKLFNTNPSKLHNSLVDILVTLRCYIKFIYDYDITRYNEIKKKFKGII